MTTLSGFLTEKLRNTPDFAVRFDENSWMLPSFRITDPGWESEMNLVLNPTCVIFRGPGSCSSRSTLSSHLKNCNGFANLITTSLLFEGGNFIVHASYGKQRTEDFGKRADNNAIYSNFVVCHEDDEYELEKLTGYRVDDIAGWFEKMENEHFVYLCKQGYPETAVEKAGVSCLKGIDDARFRATIAANKLLPENKRLHLLLSVYCILAEMKKRNLNFSVSLLGKIRMELLSHR
ncbi:hypothetical protein HK098_002059 [Nowakowskiella sp. JEL0407]|nr:hypothetical protein HK098_002059 [Nowakowskiella sp. JEL0407]